MSLVDRILAVEDWLLDVERRIGVLRAKLRALRELLSGQGPVPVLTDVPAFEADGPAERRREERRRSGA